MNAVMTAAHDGGEETVNLTEETEEETDAQAAWVSDQRK